MILRRRSINNIQTGVIKGVWWAGLGQFTTRLMGFLSIVILSKLLEARDFGLIAIAMFVFNLIAIAGDLGLRSAMIQKQDKEEEASQIIFWITGGLGLGYFILGFFLASYIARFYNEQVLVQVIKVLSLTLFLGPLSNTQTVLFQKKLEFKKFNMALILSHLAKVILSIYLACIGLGVWALVWGMVLQTALYSLIMWLMLPWRPRLGFDWSVFKELFSFGKPITIFSILAFVILNGDQAFIGKVLGSAALGYYSLAFGLSNFSALNITAVVQYVLFPAYALLQSDTHRLREGFHQSLRYISFIVFPLSLGIFVLAREITLAIYGEKWLPMVPSLRVLSFFGLFRSLNWFGGNIFLAKGKVKLMQHLAWGQFLIMVILIYPLTIKWGILGTAIAVTLAMGINVCWYFKHIAGLLEGSLCEIIKNVKVSLLSTLAMVAGLFILRRIFAVPSVFSLAVIILGGTLIYLSFVFALDKNIKKDIHGIVGILAQK